MQVILLVKNKRVRMAARFVRLWLVLLHFQTISCVAFIIGGHAISPNHMMILSPLQYKFDKILDVNDMSQLPSPLLEMTAQDAVTTCLDALLHNDNPRINIGLEVCFEFSSDRCRASLGGSLEEFISYASNPTFSSMTNAKDYTIVNVGPIIAGTNTRGAMQTVLIQVTPAKGKDRHFLW